MANTNKYLSHLLQNTGITPACSEEERAAANDIAGIFTAHGFQPEIQEFASSGSKKVVYAGLGIASFAGAVLMGMGGAAGLIGVVLGVASAVLLLLERNGHQVLSQLGRGGLSQNVVAYHQASGPLASPRNRPVVVVAHYDSPRCDLLSREPFAAYRPMVIRFMPHAMVVSAACGIVHMLPFPAAAQTVLWIVALLAGLLPLAYAVSVIANRFVLPYTTGSVCNKSSVAAMLGVMDSVAPYQHGEEFPHDQPADEYFAEQRRIVEEAIAAAEADAAAAEAAAMTYPHEAAAAASALDAVDEAQDTQVAPPEPQMDMQAQAGVTTAFEAIDGTGHIGQISDGARIDDPVIDPVKEDGADEAPSVVDVPCDQVASEVFPAPVDSAGVLDKTVDEPAPSIVSLGEEPSGSAVLSAEAEQEESAAAAVESADEDAPEPASCATDVQPAVEPDPEKPYTINRDGNIRFGEKAIRSLGMLPTTCVIEYETHDDAPSSNHAGGAGGNGQHRSYVKPVAAAASVAAHIPAMEPSPVAVPAVAPIASVKASAPVADTDEHAAADVNKPAASSDATMVFEVQESNRSAETAGQVHQSDFQEAPTFNPQGEPEEQPAPVRLQPSSAYSQQPSPAAPVFNGDDGVVHQVEAVRPSLRELLGAEPIDDYEVIEPPVVDSPAEAPNPDVAPVADNEPADETVAVCDQDAKCDHSASASDAEPLDEHESVPAAATEVEVEDEHLDPAATIAVEALDVDRPAGTTQLFSSDDMADATVERTAVRIETEKPLEKTQQQGPAPIQDPVAVQEPAPEAAPAVAPAPTSPRPIETVDSLMAQISNPAPAPAPKPAPKRHIDVPSTADAPAPHTPVTANRASLFDLPDPSAQPLDPFASNDQHMPAPSDHTGNGFSVVDTPAPSASPDRFETISAPAPVEEQPRRGFGKLFGRKKKHDDSMSDWLGVDDDFDAKSMGGDIGSWDNFDDDGWKGGAASSTDLAEADLREAVASMGDDELLGHDIWFVATGASENGNAGIQSFLDAHRDKLRGVFLINLESVGAGSLAYLTTEGEERVLRGDRRISSLVSRVSSDFHHEFTPIDMPYVTTDAHAAMGMSLRSLTVAGIDGTGFALSHTEDDQPYNVEPENVALVSDVVTEVIRRS